MPNPLDFFLSVLRAVDENERERTNQQVVIDSAYASRFQLYSFVVIDQTGRVIDTIQYSSYLTQDALDELNYYAIADNLWVYLEDGSRFPNPVLTIDDVISRPEETFDFWNGNLRK